MFCPKCATQNIDGASFCRSCGANISLIPHALSGKLPVAPMDDDSDRGSRRKRRGKRPPTIDEGVRNLIMGIAFCVVAILIGKYSPGGWTWWYWMLIPAATFIGRGFSDIIRAKQANAIVAGQRAGASLPPASDFPANAYAGPQRRVEAGLPRTAELMPPAPSVTEGTTRHLGAEAPTRTLDSPSDEKRS
jgi:zinc-ribbon domain